MYIHVYLAISELSDILFIYAGYTNLIDRLQQSFDLTIRLGRTGSLSIPVQPAKGAIDTKLGLVHGYLARS